MAQGLMGLQDLLGQSSNSQQQSGLLGGGVFSQPESRGRRRSRLLNEAIAGAGQNPYARLGASFGGLIGMGGRAAGEGLGILDKPEEVQQAEAIRQVQQEAADQGLNVANDPRGFGDFVAGRFQELGQPQLATRSLLQARQIESQFAPEQPEIPSDFRSLSMRAQAAELEPGTDEYKEFFRTGGKERSTTQRERERDYYLSQGYSERLATDLANNNIKTTTDFAGRTQLVNITGGPVPDSLPQDYDAAPATEGSTVPTNEQGQPTGTGQQEQGTSGGQMSRRGQRGDQDQTREPQGLVDRPLRVGLVPYLQEGLSRTVGQFFPENFTFAETTEDRTQLRSARQQLISALSISGKPPVIEQERIERNLPGLGPLESPERAQAQLGQLTGDLLRQRQADLEALDDSGVNQTLKRDIQKRINGVDAMLRLVDPRALQTGEPTQPPDFSFDEAQSVLGGAIDNGQLPEGSDIGAYDYESQAYPIIIDGQQATDSEGTPLYILPDEDN